MNNLYLIINILIWLITFIYYQYKRKHIDVGSVLIFSFLFFAFASFIHFNLTFSDTYDDLTLFPFIYLYIILMMVMWPVLKYNDHKVIQIQSPNSLLLNIIIYIYMFSSVIFFTNSLDKMYDGIYTIINNPMGGLDIYNDTMDNSIDIGDGLIENIFAILTNIFSDIGILLFFYYLTLNKKNKFIVIGLTFSMISSVFFQLALSQRGPAIDRLLTIIIAYFALRKFIPDKINKKIKKIGVLMIVLFSIPMIAITVSRFGESELGSEGSFYAYTGQQNLNFNNYAFDNNGLRYGDRTFPMFKSILGFDNVPRNFWERRIKYPNLKINDEVFIGFVGDFLLDFGPYISTLIFILFAINALYRTRIRNNTVLFHQLIFLYFIMCVCIQGGIKLYSFSDVGGNLKLIVYILVYFAFKLDFKNNMHNQNINFTKYE